MKNVSFTKTITVLAMFIVYTVSICDLSGDIFDLPTCIDGIPSINATISTLDSGLEISNTNQVLRVVKGGLETTFVCDGPNGEMNCTYECIDMNTYCNGDTGYENAIGALNIDLTNPCYCTTTPCTTTRKCLIGNVEQDCEETFLEMGQEQVEFRPIVRDYIPFSESSYHDFNRKRGLQQSNQHCAFEFGFDRVNMNITINTFSNKRTLVTFRKGPIYQETAFRNMSGTIDLKQRFFVVSGDLIIRGYINSQLVCKKIIRITAEEFCPTPKCTFCEEFTRYFHCIPLAAFLGLDFSLFIKLVGLTIIIITLIIFRKKISLCCIGCFPCCEYTRISDDSFEMQIEGIVYDFKTKQYIGKSSGKPIHTVMEDAKLAESKKVKDKDIVDITNDIKIFIDTKQVSLEDSSSIKSVFSSSDE